MENKGHCPNLEMKKVTEIVVNIVCDTEGALAYESGDLGSRPGSLSHLLCSFTQGFCLLWIVSPCVQRRNGD